MLLQVRRNDSLSTLHFCIVVLLSAFVFLFFYIVLWGVIYCSCHFSSARLFCTHYCSLYLFHNLITVFVVLVFLTIIGVANNGYSQTILVTNFQFNIPTDAVIEGIQVVWSKGSQATGCKWPFGDTLSLFPVRFCRASIYCATPLTFTLCCFLSNSLINFWNIFFSVNDSDISLVVAGSVVNTTNKCAVAGSNVCKSWLANGTATFRDDSYGAQNDLWGLSLTPADVNAVGKRFISYATTTRTCAFYCVTLLMKKKPNGFRVIVGFGASLQVKRVVSSVRAAYVESVKMSVFYSGRGFNALQLQH